VHADDEQQRAADEATFREANERIREVQAELELSRQRVPFICECDDTSCREPILLGAEEYERVRSDGTCFVIVAGHSTLGEIVEERDGHAVVRKTGLGGLVAAELDPREEAPWPTTSKRAESG
jgi:hypothetical protein